jgi:hypothetical protein
MPIDSARWDAEVVPHLNSIDEMKSDLLAVQRRIWSRRSKNLFLNDLLYSSAINRTLKNTGGFAFCLRDRRYFVATLVIRGQLDTLCRVWGLQVVPDQGEYVKAFMKGQIRSLTDRDGKRLTDRCLIEHLGTVLPWTLTMYDELAAFAHLSNKHFFGAFGATDDEGGISGHTSEWDEDVPIGAYLEACRGFKAVTAYLLQGFDQYASQGEDH